MIDRERLVADALAAVSIPSFTGTEEPMAAWYAGQCEELGLAVQWQQVEDGRANVLATRAGTGGGPTLMFNGHLDTSYSGREPWLDGIPGFQPQGFEREGRIYGRSVVTPDHQAKPSAGRGVESLAWQIQREHDIKRVDAILLRQVASLPVAAPSAIRHP